MQRLFYFLFTFAACLLLLAVADVPMVAQGASTSSKLPLTGRIGSNPRILRDRNDQRRYDH